MNVRKISLFILPISFYICSVPTQEVFLRANQEYKKGDHIYAQTVYQSIEHKGPAIWFNLGNCFYEQKKFVDALIAWRRSQKFGISHISRVAEKSIKRAQDSLGISRGSRMHRFYKEINLLVSSIGLWFLQIIFLFCGIFLLLFISRLWLSSIGRIIGLLLIGILIVSFIGIAASWYDMNYCHAVVKEVNVELSVGPGDDYHRIGSFRQGSEFVIAQERGEWYKIQSPDTHGWLKKDVCEII